MQTEAAGRRIEHEEREQKAGGAPMAAASCRFHLPTRRPHHSSSARRREAGKVAAPCSPNHFCCGCGRERKASAKAKDSLPPQCQCHSAATCTCPRLSLAQCRVSIHIRATKDHRISSWHYTTSSPRPYPPQIRLPRAPPPKVGRPTITFKNS